jgi:predicted hotdog family 3-hydroxylacyl-ACP dehydratase
MMIAREEIAGLIPHAGTMCLLDSVVSWDESSIRCVSTRHHAPDNPLRHEERLGISCAIEFAAQAMAVHGRLAGAVSARPRMGYLVSLRDVVFHRARLDDTGATLTIDATRLMGDDTQVAYSFSIASDGKPLISGRATVMLDVTA